MKTNLTQFKNILLLVLTITTLSISAKSIVYSFHSMTENSEFIGSIKITNKNKLMGNNNFLCGYQYDFEILQVEKGNLQKHTFWSMSDQYNIDNKYQIFLEPSNTIVDSRIKDFKQAEKYNANIELITPFQECKKIIPKLGVSAGGNGIFKIELNNKNKKYISFNGHSFTNSNVNKACNIMDYKPDSIVKLNCIQKHIKTILDNKLIELQKTYNQMIKKVD